MLKGKVTAGWGNHTSKTKKYQEEKDGGISQVWIINDPQKNQKNQKKDQTNPSKKSYIGCLSSSDGLQSPYIHKYHIKVGNSARPTISCLAIPNFPCQLNNIT